MQYQAIIFDCDGTLADTMPLHFRAWQRTARRHGFSFPEHRFYALGGVPSHEIVALLAAEQGLVLDAPAVAHEKDELYVALIDQVEPIEPILDVVRRHHGRTKLAVASGGSRRTTGQALAHLGIERLFDAVVTAEDVGRHKPAPDVFLEAARRLGVPPERCLAFEDTDIGIRAIRSAGMTAVDVRLFARAGATRHEA
jgi:beta-phosphoglucomutase family hydrolase